MSIQAQSSAPFIQRFGIVRSYPRMSEIIREGDAANRVYEVISVCTCKTLREGRRQIAGFYFSGDLFGLEAAGNHALAAQAITDAKVRSVKKQALSAWASSDGELADRLLTLTAHELHASKT
jgi:CRP/FNR family transcriptional regulator, nitrogen fixation regulation protein